MTTQKDKLRLAALVLRWKIKHGSKGIAKMANTKSSRLEVAAEVMDMIGDAGDFAPVVDAAIKTLVGSYAPILAEQAEEFRAWKVKMRLKSIKEYKEGGLTTDQAIALMVNPQRVMPIGNSVAASHAGGLVPKGVALFGNGNNQRPHDPAEAGEAADAD